MNEYKKTLKVGSVAVGLLMLITGTSQAAIISLATLDNIAPSATVTFSAPPLAGAAAITGESMSDKNAYDESVATILADGVNSATLTWGSSFNLASISTYVTSDVPSGIDSFLARETASVSLYLNGSGTPTETIADTSFIVAPEDPTSIWSKVTFSGVFVGVTSARLEFTPSGSLGVRVGEIIVNAVPEPASMTLLGLGGLMMLKRRRQSR